MAGDTIGSLEEVVKSVPLPEGIFWLEDDMMLKRGYRMRGCCFHAYLWAEHPEPGCIYYHPILIGIGHNLRGPDRLRRRVENAIANFQVAMEKGKALVAREGDTLGRGDSGT